MTSDPRSPLVEQLRDYVQHRPDCPCSLPRIALDFGPGWTQGPSFIAPCNCGLKQLLDALIGSPPQAPETEEDLRAALEVPLNFWRSYFKSHGGQHWTVNDEFWRQWLDAYGHLLPEER